LNLKTVDFKSLVLKLGTFRVVVLITVFSVLLSVLLTVVITLMTGAGNLTHLDWRIIVGIAVIVPLIIAPLVSYSLVSLIFKIHQLETEMRALATIDDLTGLLNRGELVTRAAQLHRLALREAQPLLILMVDIDHFKKINDQYGHAAGDIVLQQFGDILKKSARATDLVGRVGGEEFLFCLYGANLDEVIQLTERIHGSLRQKVFSFDEHTFSVTASIGVAHMGAQQVTALDTLWQRADKAMYEAKQAGRNQTKLYQ
jgi:diguanylate cyclase